MTGRKPLRRPKQERDAVLSARTDQKCCRRQDRNALPGVHWRQVRVAGHDHFGAHGQGQREKFIVFRVSAVCGLLRHLHHAQVLAQPFHERLACGYSSIAIKLWPQQHGLQFCKRSQRRTHVVMQQRPAQAPTQAPIAAESQR